MKSIFFHRLASPVSQYLTSLVCLLVLLGGSGNLLSAYGQAGSAAVVFLKIEPDSRSAGMGNAGVALADNASAMFWNPAGLAYQRGLSLA